MKETHEMVGEVLVKTHGLKDGRGFVYSLTMHGYEVFSDREFLSEDEALSSGRSFVLKGGFQAPRTPSDAKALRPERFR